MAAGIYNFIIEQGVTLTKTFTYTDANGDPIDLTGYDARMQGRATMQSSATVFERTTTPASGLDIPVGTDGQIVLTMTAAETADIPCGGVYDLEIISPTSVVTRLLQGTFSLSYEVTR